MRIFVAYGYNERDRWVEELVFPVIRAFGDEVVTGEELQGEQITDAVIAKIRSSDALIGFLTRRDQIGSSDRWTTHRWVTDEISQAVAQRIFVAEVRESGVDEQGGIAGDRQRLTYREAERDACLVELVKTLGRWHQVNHVTLQVLPDACAQAIVPLLRDPSFNCTYRWLMGFDESGDLPAKVFPIKGGVFIQTRSVPRGAMIQVQVKCGNQSWTSNFESTDSLGINLRQD